MVWFLKMEYLIWFVLSRFALLVWVVRCPGRPRICADKEMDHEARAILLLLGLCPIGEVFLAMAGLFAVSWYLTKRRA